MNVDIAYSKLIEKILTEGDEISTRNSVVKRITAEKIVFDSTPLVSVRKTAWKSALREWEWFMSGSSNIADLHPSVHKWWEPWADEDGEVVNNYSQQFRYFSSRYSPVPESEHGLNGTEYAVLDQIHGLVEGIRQHPYSRRNILTTWNAAEMMHPETKITNCHNSMTQAFVGTDGKLSLVTYQRSADVICGVTHNWIQLWAFLLWLSAQVQRPIGTLTWVGGDIHIYSSHYELAKKISGVLLAETTPTLCYCNPQKDFIADDFCLVDGEYKPFFTDKAEMVV